jgi:hypothetical protein
VVAPTGTPGSRVDTVLAERGLRRRIALRVTNFLIAPVVVCETDLVNTMPSRLARQLARTYPLRSLSASLEIPTGARSLDLVSRRQDGSSWRRTAPRGPSHTFGSRRCRR